jgi:hypothetical protein
MHVEVCPNCHLLNKEMNKKAGIVRAQISREDDAVTTLLQEICTLLQQILTLLRQIFTVLQEIFSRCCGTFARNCSMPPQQDETSKPSAHIHADVFVCVYIYVYIYIYIYIYIRRDVFILS